MSDQEGKLSRRNFLRGMGTGAAAVAVATVLPEVSNRSEQQERQEFYNTIKSITYEDLNSPESDKLAVFTRMCASEYARVTGLEIDVDDLTGRTKFFRTEDEFYEAIKKAEPSFVPNDNVKLFGRVSYSDDTARINLRLIRDGNTSLETEYPGAKLFKSLCHEWGDVLSIDNRNGKYLHDPREKIGDREGNNAQVWERFRGGKIYTQDYHALTLFGNAWNELVTRRVVAESLKDDAELRPAMITLSNDSAYREATDKLSRIVERVGLTTQEMAEMHMKSDVEGMLTRIGAAFGDPAVALLSDINRGGRTDEEVAAERDFLLGKRAAFLITQENWDGYRDMVNNIKPRN